MCAATPNFAVKRSCARLLRDIDRAPRVRVCVAPMMSTRRLLLLALTLAHVAISSSAFVTGAHALSFPRHMRTVSQFPLMLAKKKGGKRKKPGASSKKVFAPPPPPPPAASLPSPAAIPQQQPSTTSTAVSSLAARVAAKAGAADLSQQHNLGMDLMAARKYDEAGLAFEAVIDADPEAIDSWSALGVCLQELGQTDAALVCQKQVLRLRSGSTSAQFSQAQFEEITVASDGALPPLPDGRQLRLATGPLDACETGGRLWSSAVALSRWLLPRADQLQGTAVLELGCGTGAVGLYAAALGASKVTLTDGGPAALLSLARANAADPGNVELWSGREGATSADVSVEAFSWGSPTGPLGRFDWILAADVTYSTSAHAALCESLAAQLREHSPGCRVLVAHEVRAIEGEEDGKLASFLRAAGEAGLAVKTRETDEHDGRTIVLLEVGDARAAAADDAGVDAPALSIEDIVSGAPRPASPTTRPANPPSANPPDLTSASASASASTSASASASTSASASISTSASAFTSASISTSASASASAPPNTSSANPFTSPPAAATARVSDAVMQRLSDLLHGCLALQSTELWATLQADLLFVVATLLGNSYYLKCYSLTQIYKFRSQCLSSRSHGHPYLYRSNLFIPSLRVLIPSLSIHAIPIYTFLFIISPCVSSLCIPTCR